MSDSLFEDFHSISFLEQEILSGNPAKIIVPDIMKTIEFNILFLGGIYLDYIKQSIDTNSASERVLLAKIETINGNADIAFNMAASLVQEDLSLDDRVWIAYCYADNERYSDAMCLAEDIINADSSLTAAWCLKAILLLRDGMNYEAYNVMSQALLLTDSAPECMALQGLATEFSGRGRLAAESFAPLLELSSDSIVLVNRMRSLIYNRDLNYNFEYEDFNDFSSLERKWISGTINLDYSSSTGELEQSNLGFSISLKHKYGLYGSFIKTSAGYFRQKWPGSTKISETGSALLSAVHYNRDLFYSSISASWNRYKYDVSRWKMGLSTSLGHSFDLGTSLGFSLELGVGRQINRWDSEEDYEATWIGKGQLASHFSGRMYQNYFPDFSLSMSVSQDLTNLSRYDINGNVDMCFFLSRLLSLSTGYLIEHFSALPPLYEDISNSSTYIRFSIQF